MHRLIAERRQQDVVRLAQFGSRVSAVNSPSPAIARTRRSEPRTALSKRFSSLNSSTSSKPETTTTGAPIMSSQKIGPSSLTRRARCWTGLGASIDSILPTTGFRAGGGSGSSAIWRAMRVLLRLTISSSGRAPARASHLRRVASAARSTVWRRELFPYSSKRTRERILAGAKRCTGSRKRRQPPRIAYARQRVARRDVTNGAPLAGLTPPAARRRASSSTRSFFDSLPTGVLGSASRTSSSEIISCLPRRSLRNDFNSSRPSAGEPGFSATKAFGDCPR